VLCETHLEILPAWTDWNGHMNVAYYVLAFDRATDTLYDRARIGWSYLEREQRSLFTLSMNVDFLGEVFAGDSVRIVSRLIDFDHKRIHYLHEMHRSTMPYLAATNEILAMHVNMATRRSEPFPLEAQVELARMKAAHSALPLPAQVGRKLAIRGKDVAIKHSASVSTKKRTKRA
jgi:acyl-CoA thioester hydrolase